nr:hypothetical protein [uncultured Rhodoferax sp.]
MMIRWLDRLPVHWLLLFALGLGLAPFTPEPHLVEKLRMLAQGTLVRPLDIWDLCMHSAPLLVLAAKLGRIGWLRFNRP